MKRRISSLIKVLVLFVVMITLSACASKSIQMAEGEYVIIGFYHMIHSGTYFTNLGVGDVLVLELKRADGENLTSSDLEAIVSSGASISPVNSSGGFTIARHQLDASFFDVNTDSFGLEFGVQGNIEKGDLWTLKWPGNEPIDIKVDY